ncbi:MAG: putative DNA methylase [uncultured bacterium]|nr:MAG: putative DNA methylase [uncultured bacterium]KKT75638.1 MAG: hypothetical protein UW70_C0032G0013 [Candidatus Peregrinibacteria bacterium GW2011_GWA2_44_7]
MHRDYLFHLGRETELCFAELEAIFSGNRLERHGEVALVEMEGLKQPQSLLDSLGGSLKISEIVTTVESEEDKVVEKLTTLLENQKQEGKLIFGLSIAPQHDLFLNKILKKVKQNMKNSGRNARFINKEGNPNTAIIVKSGLMKHGMDFNLTRMDDHFAISQTVAIQNAHFYELRDYGKPLRLRREGMLPPKLAQIMINLSGIVQRGIDLTDTTLYDPFCGSGTVLGEALLKGMNVIGSDIERSAIEATGINLKNLQEQGLGREEASTRVFLQDATALVPRDLPRPPDLVVSESYLGPPQNHFPTEEEIHDLYPKLIPIYRNFFKSLHPCLKPGTPVLIALPLYHTNKKAVRLPNLVDKLIPIQYKLKRTLLYHRPNQVVGREILVLETL